MKNMIRCLVGSLMIAVAAILFAGCGGGGSSKMDAALDNLEKTCEKTASVNQRIKSGDQAASAELATVVKEFQDFSTSLQSAGTMSAAQQKRYEEIMQKYMKSMQ